MLAESPKNHCMVSCTVKIPDGYAPETASGEAAVHGNGGYTDSAVPPEAPQEQKGENKGSICTAGSVIME